jgi:hypothetical protein
VAAWEWWGSTRGSPATDLKREQGREVVGRGLATEQWWRSCCSSVPGEGVARGGR